jgi:exodeoxyribonuclease VII small subunit
MSDERSTFEVTRARLEDIVTQARRKDVSLEQSLDLLEEAVRLVNQCNELIDQTSFRATVEGDGAAEQAGGVDAEEAAESVAGAAAGERAEEGLDASGGIVEVVETYEVVDTGDGAVAVIEMVEVSPVVDEVPDAQGVEDDERS